MKPKMGISYAGELDVGMVENHSGAHIVAEEQLVYRYRATSVGNPDLGTDGEILHRGLDQIFCPWRAIDIDGLGSLVIPSDGHERTESCSVIVVMVSDEDSSHISNVEPRLSNAACSTVAGAHDIKSAIDNQKIGRLRP